MQQSDDRIKVSKAQFKESNMALGNLEERKFPISIKVNGMIDVPPEKKAIINSITGVYTKTVPLLVGNIVKKGTTACHDRELRICANTTRIHGR